MATKKAAKKTARKTSTKKRATASDKETETRSAANEPESKLTNLQDNSVSAREMSALRGSDAKTAKLAAADTDTQERIEEETAERKAEEDMSVYGRLTRSGLVLNENQITGERWVGESIQCDPEADQASKNRTRITPLAEVRPWRGLQVRPKNGEPFAVGDEVDKDTTPAYWLSLIDPNTKKPLIAA